MIRGIFQSLTETAGKVRRFIASGRVRETIRNGALYQHAYFVSDPPEGTKVIVFGTSGNEASVAEDHPGSRPQLKSLNGAVSIFYDADHYVLIKKDGSVVIKTDQAVTIDSAVIKLGGSTGTRKIVDSRLLTLLATAQIPVFAPGAPPTPTGQFAMFTPGTISELLQATINTEAK